MCIFIHMHLFKVIDTKINNMASFKIIHLFFQFIMLPFILISQVAAQIPIHDKGMVKVILAQLICQHKKLCYTRIEVCQNQFLVQFGYLFALPLVISGYYLTCVLPFFRLGSGKTVWIVWRPLIIIVAIVAVVVVVFVVGCVFACLGICFGCIKDDQSQGNDLSFASHLVLPSSLE